MIDEIDRQIVAALIRNGRAPFRLIAEVLGQQERTVARRANKLLASGIVRIQSFPNPSAMAPVDLYMLRVAAEPAQLDTIARWLAERSETHWISSLTGASECIVELFLEPARVNDFLYEQLARVSGVRAFSLDPIFEYYRTVSGWRPDILTNEQYDRLSPSESPRFVTGYANLSGAPLEESKRTLVELLRNNGRTTIEEVANGLGVSKTTASRRVETIISEGVLFVRAILDPGVIGYPVESYLEIGAEAGAVERLGKQLADLPTTRWAANVAGKIQVQGAFQSLAELYEVTRAISELDSVRGIEISLFSRIYKRSTVVYENGVLPAQ